MTGSIHQNTPAGPLPFQDNYPFFGNCPQTTPEVSGRGMGLAKQLHPTLKEQARDDFQQSGQPEEHRATEHQGMAYRAW